MMRQWSSVNISRGNRDSGWQNIKKKLPHVTRSSKDKCEMMVNTFVCEVKREWSTWRWLSCQRMEGVDARFLGSYPAVKWQHIFPSCWMVWNYQHIIGSFFSKLQLGANGPWCGRGTRVKIHPCWHTIKANLPEKWDAQGSKNDSTAIKITNTWHNFTRA